MKENNPDSPENLSMEGVVQDIMDTLLYQREVFAIGVGGCGCNTVEYISEKNMENVKTIGINTDKRVLDLNVDRQMLIGKELTDGKGANGDPNLGKRAAVHNEEQILKAIDGADFVVLVAGMGGGTGTGASKVIADLARRNGKLVVTFAVMPFSVEKDRYEIAQTHIEKLSKLSNATTIFENDRALELGENKTPNEAFKVTNRMLHQLVQRLQMDYVTEFFHEVGIEDIGFLENLSVDKNELIEEPVEAEQKVEEPPVLEALRCVEEGQTDLEDFNQNLEPFPDNHSC